MSYPRINSQTATATATHAPATAQISAPGRDMRWHISQMLVTVSGGTATFQLLSGSTVLWQGHVSSTAPVDENFEPPLQADPNTAISVVVGDAGAGNTGSANLKAHLL